MEYSDTIYIIASDRASRSKATQVALKTIFRLKKRKPQKDLKVKIASIDELKRSQFRDWFEVKSKG